MKCVRCFFPKDAPLTCKKCGRAKYAPSAELPGAAPVLVFDAALQSVDRERLRAEQEHASSLASNPVSISQEPALPAHSPLGASGAERWMNCPGSYHAANVVRQMGRFDEGDPEYRTQGVNAHTAAAYCLETGTEAWMLTGQPNFLWLDADMVVGLTRYTEYVWKRVESGAQLDVEHRLHRPEIHPLYFGTLDASLLWGSNVEGDRPCLEIVDYKHGAGIVVDVEENAQVMYYANGRLAEFAAAGVVFPDDALVRLTIVQPNAFHPSGQIRSWDTTAGYLRKWLVEKLVPAMNNAGGTEYKIGEWCRFCPAVLACPAYDSLVERVIKGGTCTYTEARQLKILIKRREEQEFKDLLNGLNGTGGMLVHKTSYRAWKTGADQVLIDEFGTGAWEPPALISPAVAEKLPGGDKLVAEWAWQPPSSEPTVALVGSKKKPWVKSATTMLGYKE